MPRRVSGEIARKRRAANGRETGAARTSTNAQTQNPIGVMSSMTRGGVQMVSFQAKRNWNRIPNTTEYSALKYSSICSVVLDATW